MGLLRTAARTAVVTGTATRVHHRVAARQQGRWATQTVAPPPQVTPAPPPPAAAAPPPAAPGAPARDTSAMIAHLTDLGRLRDAGVLTEAEFEVQKAIVLRG